MGKGEMIMKAKNRKPIKVSHVVATVVLLIGSVIMLLPFVWMALTAFKTFPETVKLPIQWLPSNPNFDNFAEVMNKLNFGLYYKNTIITTVAITALQVLICSMAAYGFGRLNAPGRDALFFIVLSMLMIPPQMTQLPQYVLMSKFGLINTMTVLIVPRIFSSYGTFFLRQFFISLPRELEESARIDGCSYFRCWWNIIMPLCGTAVAAFSIFTVLWAWNDMMWPLIMTSSESLRVLPVGIATLAGQHGTKNNLMMAASMMATLPMIVVFILFQKQFISGIATTGLKV